MELDTDGGRGGEERNKYMHEMGEGRGGERGCGVRQCNLEHTLVALHSARSQARDGVGKGEPHLPRQRIPPIKQANHTSTQTTCMMTNNTDPQLFALAAGHWTYVIGGVLVQDLADGLQVHWVGPDEGSHEAGTGCGQGKAAAHTGTHRQQGDSETTHSGRRGTAPVWARSPPPPTRNTLQSLLMVVGVAPPIHPLLRSTSKMAREQHQPTHLLMTKGRMTRHLCRGVFSQIFLLMCTCISRLQYLRPTATTVRHRGGTHEGEA